MTPELLIVPWRELDNDDDIARLWAAYGFASRAQVPSS